jgi:hypothetical protein
MTECATSGVIFAKTNESIRGEITGYHRKPDPLKINKTKWQVDIKGLPISKRKNIEFDELAGYQSRFTIGFEVEKNELDQDALHEHEMFCGFEYDSSCGYEAVTHILPLLPGGRWRNKVFEMFYKAERIIDDEFSPSDDTCGGHITIGVNGWSGDRLRECVRKNSGLIYALYRHRLQKIYCRNNRRMESTDKYWDWHGVHSKYQVALVKEFGLDNGVLEFRLPSKFENVKQMMRRYELFYILVDYSVNNPNGNHNAFMQRAKPILMMMYNDDSDKVKSIMRLGRKFQAFIDTGVVSKEIAMYGV